MHNRHSPQLQVCRLFASTWGRSKMTRSSRHLAAACLTLRGEFGLSRSGPTSPAGSPRPIADQAGSARADGRLFVFFHRNPALLGHTIELENRLYTVTGVLPPSFLFPTLGLQPDLLLPLDLRTLSPEGIQKLHVIGRLQNGVSRTRAHTAVAQVERSVAGGFPAWFSRYARGMRTEMRPLRETLSSTQKQSLLLLAMAALLLLLLLSLNIGALQLARSFGRQREFAVQLALGATSGQIRLGLLLESAIVSGLAGVLGVALARLSITWFARWVPASLVPFHPVTWIATN